MAAVPNRQVPLNSTNRSTHHTPAKHFTDLSKMIGPTKSLTCQAKPQITSSAPTGRHSIAQGIALGYGIKRNPSPERAALAKDQSMENTPRSAEEVFEHYMRMVASSDHFPDLRKMIGFQTLDCGSLLPLSATQPAASRRGQQAGSRKAAAG